MSSFGTCIDRSKESAAKHDEIHGDLVFKGKRYMTFASISKEFQYITITCLSATKSFNIAGLQASFAIVPKPEEYKKIDDFFTALDIKRNNCFSLVATEAAFSAGEEWLEAMIDYVDNNIEFINDFCKKRISRIVPNRPEGTYLVWLDCRSLGLSDDELFDFMINKAKIAVNSGVSFGVEGSGYVRLNLACPRKILEEALVNLEQAVNQLI